MSVDAVLFQAWVECVTATKLSKFSVGDLGTKLILDTEADICSSHGSQLIPMGVLNQLSVRMGRITRSESAVEREYFNNQQGE